MLLLENNEFIEALLPSFGDGLLVGIPAKLNSVQHPDMIVCQLASPWILGFVVLLSPLLLSLVLSLSVNPEVDWVIFWNVRVTVFSLELEQFKQTVIP